MSASPAEREHRPAVGPAVEAVLAVTGEVQPGADDGVPYVVPETRISAALRERADPRGDVFSSRLR